jgi:hypothetical protein
MATAIIVVDDDTERSDNVDGNVDTDNVDGMLGYNDDVNIMIRDLARGNAKDREDLLLIGLRTNNPNLVMKVMLITEGNMSDYSIRPLTFLIMCCGAQFGMKFGDRLLELPKFGLNVMVDMVSTVESYRHRPCEWDLGKMTQALLYFSGIADHVLPTTFRHYPHWRSVLFSTTGSRFCVLGLLQLSIVHRIRFTKMEQDFIVNNVRNYYPTEASLIFQLNNQGLLFM